MYIDFKHVYSYWAQGKEVILLENDAQKLKVIKLLSSYYYTHVLVFFSLFYFVFKYRCCVQCAPGDLKDI